MPSEKLKLAEGGRTKELGGGRRGGGRGEEWRWVGSGGAHNIENFNYIMFCFKLK